MLNAVATSLHFAEYPSHLGNRATGQAIPCPATVSYFVLRSSSLNSWFILLSFLAIKYAAQQASKLGISKHTKPPRSEAHLGLGDVLVAAEGKQSGVQKAQSGTEVEQSNFLKRKKEAEFKTLKHAIPA